MQGNPLILFLLSRNRPFPYFPDTFFLYHCTVHNQFCVFTEILSLINKKSPTLLPKTIVILLSKCYTEDIKSFFK